MSLACNNSPYGLRDIRPNSPYSPVPDVLNNPPRDREFVPFPNPDAHKDSLAPVGTLFSEANPPQSFFYFPANSLAPDKNFVQKVFSDTERRSLPLILTFPGSSWPLENWNVIVQGTSNGPLKQSKDFSQTRKCESGNIEFDLTPENPIYGLGNRLYNFYTIRLKSCEDDSRIKKIHIISNAALLSLSSCTVSVMQRRSGELTAGVEGSFLIRSSTAPYYEEKKYPFFHQVLN